MRDIKFRAWSDTYEDMEFFDLKRLNQESFPFYKNMIDADNAYVMQYTGLKDKDGIEIYEGDIVKIHHEDFDFYYGAEVGIVAYDEHSFDCFAKMDDSKSDEFIERDIFGMKMHYTTGLDYIQELIEVIGNIHENQELLNN